ncbi:MAG TPA: ABC transporter permease subunit [Candidatus Caldiarchaeum subterraneum]|uniref:ABC transporter permease subunit n=1 Tax=Caldiarchaeum subterraneum TaxID=311458 RepID=A0A832ZYA3_CALS0|nr:ABC transporter permease subunit [Candidatus Caldarchaeum subterraneum]
MVLEELAIAWAAVGVSWLRMAAALFLSVGFSLLVGGVAALNKRAEKIIIPLLDVLQSIPILGFFPLALYGFYTLSPAIGAEAAAIFLIFTSQVWNLTFAVYESIKVIPAEFIETSKALGLSPWARATKLYIPSTLPRIFVGFVSSWSNGLYFLVASEIIDFGELDVKLFGLGSTMASFASAGNVTGMAVTLAVLVAAIILTDLFVFLPLIHYSGRFKFEATAVEDSPIIPLSSVFKGRKLVGRLPRIRFPSPEFMLPRIPLGWLTKRVRFVKTLLYALAITLLAYLIFLLPLLREIPLQKLLYGFLERIYTIGPYNIILDVAFSLARVATAVLFAVAWSIPLAIYLATNRRAALFTIPIIQVAASIPATITYPIFASLLQGYDELRTFILIIMGMQWYVFFAAYAGMRRVPSEEREVLELYNIRGLAGLKVLYLPRGIPSIISGCIAATGGAWNTLVVAERMKIGGVVAGVKTPGLGKAISVATEMGDIYSLALLVAVMVIVIISINKVFWRKLYELATSKLRFPEAT